MSPEADSAVLGVLRETAEHPIDRQALVYDRTLHGMPDDGRDTDAESTRDCAGSGWLDPSIGIRPALRWPW